MRLEEVLDSRSFQDITCQLTRGSVAFTAEIPGRGEGGHWITPALPSFGDEDAPAWPGDDQSFIHEDLDSAAGCGPRDPVGLGQPVQAWHLLARQKLATGDLLAQFRSDTQIGRYQLSNHKINVPSRPLICVCTRLYCAVLG